MRPSGTQCSRFAFIRMAEIVHTRSAPVAAASCDGTGDAVDVTARTRALHETGQHCAFLIEAAAVLSEKRGHLTSFYLETLWSGCGIMVCRIFSIEQSKNWASTAYNRTAALDVQESRSVRSVPGCGVTFQGWSEAHDAHSALTRRLPRSYPKDAVR